jgi:hypothetical protein
LCLNAKQPEHIDIVTNENMHGTGVSTGPPNPSSDLGGTDLTSSLQGFVGRRRKLRLGIGTRGGRAKPDCRIMRRRQGHVSVESNSQHASVLLAFTSGNVRGGEAFDARRVECGRAGDGGQY